MGSWKEFEAARLRRQELLREERVVRVTRPHKKAPEPFSRRVLGLLGLGDERWICWSVGIVTTPYPARTRHTKGRG